MPGNLLLEMHPLMQDPADLDGTTDNSVNEVVVLHTIEPASG